MLSLQDGLGIMNADPNNRINFKSSLKLVDQFDVVAHAEGKFDRILRADNVSLERLYKSLDV